MHVSILRLNTNQDLPYSLQSILTLDENVAATRT